MQKINPDIKYSDESSEGDGEEVKNNEEIIIKSEKFEDPNKDFDYNDGFMISFTPA